MDGERPEFEAGTVAVREALLKRDAFGTVERWRVGSRGERVVVRRTASGALLGWLAARLAHREQRALETLRPDAELEGRVPRPRPVAGALAGALAADGGRTFAREHLAGVPLHLAERLPRDFFARLAELVRAVHARGVCHNDLHKEQNVLVLDDGRPALLDFQLASRHARRGRTFARRCGDDLRHVEKHRLRYERRGRPKRPEERSRHALPKRSPLAGVWRRTGKPLYNAVTRGLLGRRDGEERRPSSGPWPEWIEPLERRDLQRESRP